MVESHKLLHDYLKHLATLSTGSILLIVSFIDEVFVAPEWACLVGWTIGCFTVCVCASVAAQAGNIDAVSNDKRESRSSSGLAGLGLIASWLFFSAGIVLLFVFALKNLY